MTMPDRTADGLLSDAQRLLTALERLIDDLDPGENTDPLRIVTYDRRETGRGN